METIFSAVQITPPAISVTTMSTHTISCVLSNIQSQVEVEWVTGTKVEDLGLNPETGAFKDGSQTSTLTLTSDQLTALKVTGGYNPTHIFTCKTTIGEKKVEATQTINIHSSGKHGYGIHLNIRS